MRLTSSSMLIGCALSIVFLLQSRAAAAAGFGGNKRNLFNVFDRHDDGGPQESNAPGNGGGQSSNFDSNPYSRHEDGDTGDDGDGATAGSAGSGATTAAAAAAADGEAPSYAPSYMPSLSPVSSPEEDLLQTDQALARHDNDAPPEIQANSTGQLSPMDRHQRGPPDERNVGGGGGDNNSSPSLLPSLSSMPSGLPSFTSPPSLTPSFTLVPSVTASDSPSQLPSVSPSTLPSSSPSESPTGLPSLSPSVFPSSVPSALCTSEGGAFGTIPEEDDDETTSTVVSYSYQLEVIADTNLTSVLGSLEDAISNAVIPSLFADACGNATNTTGVTTARALSWERRRRLAVVGLSPDPPEEPTSETCPATGSNTCNVVNGGMTLFMDGPDDGAVIGALADLRAAMNSGELNDANPNIVGVSYIDPETSPTSQDDGGGGLPIWVYVLIGVGAVFIIGLGVFFWRRRQILRRGGGGGMGDSLPPDDDPDPRTFVDDDYHPPDTISALTP